MKNQSLILTLLVMGASALTIAFIICMICKIKRIKDFDDVTDCMDNKFIDETKPEGETS